MNIEKYVTKVCRSTKSKYVSKICENKMNEVSNKDVSAIETPLEKKIKSVNSSPHAPSPAPGTGGGHWERHCRGETGGRFSQVLSGMLEYFERVRNIFQTETGRLDDRGYGGRGGGI